MSFFSRAYLAHNPPYISLNINWINCFAICGFKPLESLTHVQSSSQVWNCHAECQWYRYSYSCCLVNLFSIETIAVSIVASWTNNQIIKVFNQYFGRVVQEMSNKIHWCIALSSFSYTFSPIFHGKTKTTRAHGGQYVARVQVSDLARAMNLSRWSVVERFQTHKGMYVCIYIYYIHMGSYGLVQNPQESNRKNYCGWKKSRISW